MGHLTAAVTPTAASLDDLETCSADELVERIHMTAAATSVAERSDDFGAAFVRFRQHLALLRVLRRRFPTREETDLWPST